MREDNKDKQAYRNEWQRKNRDRIVLLLTKEQGEKLRELAAGQTPTQYIIAQLKL